MTHDYLVEVVAGESGTFGNVEFVPGLIEIYAEPTIIEVVTEGPQGPAGTSGTGFSFVQLTPASTWTIHHNLNRYPDPVLTIDSIPGERIYTDVSYVDLNTVIVTWPSAESGRAFL